MNSRMATIVTGSSTKMAQMMSIDQSWGFLCLSCQLSLYTLHPYMCLFVSYIVQYQVSGMLVGIKGLLSLLFARRSN